MSTGTGLEWCQYCGNYVDERTISQHGFCIPCMDKIVDAADDFTGPLDEAIEKLKGYTQRIDDLAEQQKAVRSLLHETLRAARRHPHLAKRGAGYMQTCEYCGKRFRGLKLHQRHCPDVPTKQQG